MFEEKIRRMNGAGHNAHALSPDCADVATRCLWPNVATMQYFGGCVNVVRLN
jgi:methylthioribose-1-phosphate isomerase